MRALCKDQCYCLGQILSFLVVKRVPLLLTSRPEDDHKVVLINSLECFKLNKRKRLKVRRHRDHPLRQPLVLQQIHLKVLSILLGVKASDHLDQHLQKGVDELGV
jgi:hypothetical protein